MYYHTLQIIFCQQVTRCELWDFVSEFVPSSKRAMLEFKREFISRCVQFFSRKYTGKNNLLIRNLSNRFMYGTMRASFERKLNWLILQYFLIR